MDLLFDDIVVDFLSDGSEEGHIKITFSFFLYFLLGELLV